jgi:hypothetical protein
VGRVEGERVHLLRQRDLRQIAQHLVHDLPFIVPSYKWWESPFYGVGLKVYDLLAGRYGFGRSEHLSADEIASVAGIATFPLVPLMTVATALRENLKVLAEQKSSKNLPRPVMAHNPFIDFIGFGQVEELQKTYLRAS